MHSAPLVPVPGPTSILPLNFWLLIEVGVFKKLGVPYFGVLRIRILPIVSIVVPFFG